MPTPRSAVTLYASRHDVQAAFSIALPVHVYEHNVVVCRNDDDPVIVQIGSLHGTALMIDDALARHADTLHAKLTQFFEGGAHRGLTLLRLSILDDDVDDESCDIEIYRDSVDGLIDAIDMM